MITVLIILIIIGVLLYLVNTYIPMQPTIKKIVNIVAIVFVVLYLLTAFGILPLNSHDIEVPKIRIVE